MNAERERVRKAFHQDMIMQRAYEGGGKMKPVSENSTAWSHYELTPIERLRLKKSAYNIASILTNRFTRRGGIFWMNVSQDLLAMAEKGASYVGSRDNPPSRWGYFSYYFFGVISGLGVALILGWYS